MTDQVHRCRAVFASAVVALATGTEPLRERLRKAWNHLAELNPHDIPERDGERKRFVELKTKLTWNGGNGEVQAMSDLEVHGLAYGILDAFCWLEQTEFFERGLQQGRDARNFPEKLPTKVQPVAEVTMRDLVDALDENERAELVKLCAEYEADKPEGNAA